ncbi:MAG: hypothetical protein Kow0068_15640 [Marinilabiliales bacterium]
MKDANDPLVSIIVITYNSSKFVLDTLESAKAQTYKNIELIISDDASSDNTVKICKKWLEDNKKRFVRTKLITSPVNTGVSPNCNRGLREAKGEWIKYIAGDDVLLPCCIENNIDFIKKNNNMSIVFSDQIIINESGEKIGVAKNDIKFMQLNALEQYKELLKGKSLVSAPSMFVRMKTLNDLNGFDERYEMMEDYPFFLKATKKGYRLFYNPNILIKYRKNPNSLWTGMQFNKVNDKFLNNIIQFYENILFKELIKKRMFFHLWSLFITNKLNKIKLYNPGKYNYYKNLRFLDVFYTKKIITKFLFKQ